MGNGSIVHIQPVAPIVANAYSASLIPMNVPVSEVNCIAWPTAIAERVKPRILVVLQATVWYKGCDLEAHFRELAAGAQGHG